MTAPAVKLFANALPLLQHVFHNSLGMPEIPDAAVHGDGQPRNQAEEKIKAQFPAMAHVLADACARMADNYPYFHPLYAGQMLQPPHPIARAAYALAMRLNPNNHAFDGGGASSQME